MILLENALAGISRRRVLVGSRHDGGAECNCRLLGAVYFNRKVKNK